MGLRPHREKAERNRPHREKGRSSAHTAQPPRRPPARPRPHRARQIPAPQRRSRPSPSRSGGPAPRRTHRSRQSHRESPSCERDTLPAPHAPPPEVAARRPDSGLGGFAGSGGHFVFKGAALRFVRSRWVRGCCGGAGLERARAAGPGRPGDNPPQPGLRGRSRPASMSRRGTGRGRGSPHRRTMRCTRVGGGGNKLPFLPPPHRPPRAVRMRPDPALRLPRGFPRVPPPIPLCPPPPPPSGPSPPAGPPGRFKVQRKRPRERGTGASPAGSGGERTPPRHCAPPAARAAGAAPSCDVRGVGPGGSARAPGRTERRHRAEPRRYRRAPGVWRDGAGREGRGETRPVLPG